MKFYPADAIADQEGRTPHGVRGLKSAMCGKSCGRQRSHPARGAWIEITPQGMAGLPDPSRTPHGVRGLKYWCRAAVPMP